MNETENKQSKWTIIGLILLIAALFVGVKLIFAGLDRMLPDAEPSPYIVLNQENREQSSYGARLLTQDELRAEDLTLWLEAAQEKLADNSDEQAFWLYRQNGDEYALYLPRQDRALTDSDWTATEERDSDGEYTLVLRSRTAEKSESVVPEEQIFCLKTQSKNWRGIRVRIIMDGREQEVNKLTSKDDKLYSTEEVYIGRDI